MTVNLAQAEELIENNEEVEESVWEDGGLHVYFQEGGLAFSQFMEEMRECGMFVRNITWDANCIQFGYSGNEVILSVEQVERVEVIEG